MTFDEELDCYLVLTGPRAAASSSRGGIRPSRIDSVYLFDARELRAALLAPGRAVGTASSVREELWAAAEIHPRPSSRYQMSDEQRAGLAMFSY